MADHNGLMKKHPVLEIRKKVKKLLVICEDEVDFWPDARRFLDVGEVGLAFEGIYIYLLSRDDLWKKHHALIKAVRNRLEKSIDFDALELSVMDDGLYDERKAINEWRQAVIRELGESDERATTQ